MSTLVTGTAAIALYLCASIYQGLQLRRQLPLQTTAFLLVSALAIALHGFTSFQLIFTSDGIDFSLLRMTSAIFFSVNLIVLISSLRKPVHNLFILLFPLAIVELIATLMLESTAVARDTIPTPITIHIFASILAYSLLTIAAFQALLLALQNWRLRHKHLGGWLLGIPPLQTMEELLFEVLWSGFVLLTLSLLSGLFFYQDFLAQHLAHKTVFSIIAWLFYAILLWGRHVKGWRGNTAIRWTLIGFTATALGYWGSKFVLEMLLN